MVKTRKIEMSTWIELINNIEDEWNPVSGLQYDITPDCSLKYDKWRTRNEQIRHHLEEQMEQVIKVIDELQKKIKGAVCTQDGSTLMAKKSRIDDLEYLKEKLKELD